jgi:hypothetical protein
LKGDFIIDLIPLLPLPQYVKWNGPEQHLYIIKCIRVLKCGEIFDDSRFMKIYKDYSKRRVEKLIENDPNEAYDQINDVNKITI